MKKFFLQIDKFQISFCLFIFINFLFFLKYLQRVSDYYILISFLFTSIYIVFWYFRNYINKIKIYSIHNKLIIFIFIITSILIFNKIDVNTLKVDRWSVITSFWDNYFKGDYVYFAKSHRGNYPGPMPFYFILALPFYWIKELGFLTIVGVIIFLKIIKKDLKINSHIFTTLLFTISSVFIFWEIVCRSNIFFNGTLILFVLKRFLDTTKFHAKEIIINGVLIGLILSTRNVFIIPFIIAFSYSLRTKTITLKQTLCLGFLSILFFSITFIPFLWNHYDDFKKMNPFIIQSSFLMPFKSTLLFLVLSFVLSLYCKIKDDVYFYSGISLFSTICGYYIYHFSISGFDKTFFESEADISYFILSTPFLIYYFITKGLTKHTL